MLMIMDLKSILSVNVKFHSDLDRNSTWKRNFSFHNVSMLAENKDFLIQVLD